MRVRFRAKALDDIAIIYLFRSTAHSTEVAARVEGAIFSSTELLGRYPELGSKTDHKAGVRRWPMTQYDYASFYRISKESLDILRVLDSKVVRDRHRVPGSGSDED
jgi:plasmid stabilization system protein ParE